MARTVERLSTTRILKAKVPVGKQHVMLADGGNLYLRVTTAGARSWIFKFRLNGRSQEMGLGGLNTLSIAEARQRARQHRQELLDGINPINARHVRHAEQRVKDSRQISFEECAAKVIQAKRNGWRDPRQAKQWEQSLRDFVFPSIGKLPVDRVEVGHITRILEPIWVEKYVTATRIRGRIEAILDFAAVHGWRSGENPARWKGHLEHVLAGKGKASVKHHAALDWREMAAFMVELERQEGPAALALRFTILTAARAGESLGARWSEIDWQEGTWTVADARMKAEQWHRVPLSKSALAVLREAEKGRTGDYIFPGRHGRMAHSCMRVLLRQMERRDVVIHGFRAVFKTWCSETGKPTDITEAALAHSQGKLNDAYQRGELLERRRRLMEQWARYCTQPAAGGEVVKLPRA
jgi:integrase